MSNSLCLSGSVAGRVLELADSLGLSPEDYVNALLERAVPRRRVDLMPLGFKVKVAEAVVEAALETFRRPLVVWSGGKDSTVVLHLVRSVAGRLGKGFD
ncbi:MAG: phosphoadenosine phosphosulfate reductase, partial [Vulcanisaeta sp.]|nr:phosphoadenosine phosphosulfate reductase [Vulcanisaeta sp.]